MTCCGEPTARSAHPRLVLPGQDAAALRKILRPRGESMTGDLRDAADCARLCVAGHAKGAILIHTAGIIHPRKVRVFTKSMSMARQNVLNAAIGARSAARGDRFVQFALRMQSVSRSSVRRKFALSSLHELRAVENADGAGRQRSGPARGIETVVIRPPWFYGPYQPPRQTLFFAMIRDGKAPIVGSGNNKRSMSYIDNLCQGLLLAAGTPEAAGRLYWIADKRPYSMNEIVDTVERLLENEFGQKCAHKRMRLPGLASGVALAEWTGLFSPSRSTTRKSMCYPR